MHPYASTYPQLMNQALEAGLERPALERLRQVHDAVSPLVDGFHRADGTPLLCHLVRTASILLAHGQPLHVVEGGLAHAAYEMHLFAGSRRQVGASHRGRLRAEIGPEAEALAWAYARLPFFDGEAMDALLARPQELSRETREVLLLRVANELEDHLDRAMAYTPAGRAAAHAEHYGPRAVAVARRLGCEALASELEAALAACDASVPELLRQSAPQCYQTPSRHWARRFALERWARRAWGRLRRGAA